MRRLVQWVLAWSVLTLAVGMCVGQSADETRVFRFREPALRGYRVALPKVARQSGQGAQWLEAQREGSGGGACQIGSRIVLRLSDPATLGVVTAGRSLDLEEILFGDCFVLRAADAMAAAREAQALAEWAGVKACWPEMRRPIARHFEYSAAPNDPYFLKHNEAGIGGQWHLENRGLDGRREGIDLNIRGAWAVTRGANVVVGVGDDGVELNHPDFINVGVPDLHFNFTVDAPGGFPGTDIQAHGTAVAGLIVAEGDNETGVTGVAPEARFASFPIFTSGDAIASGVQLAKAFGYESNRVHIQNHSWGNASVDLLEPSLLEQMSISNAATLGRNGLGVVFVRSGGNNRESNGNTNDDGYPNTPYNIAVAAIREDGRAATYSNPGACLLVGAPSGDDDARKLTTTDRGGNIGYNRTSILGDASDYAFETTGFSGTSGAAPQIAGVAALILSANPGLAVRDVQQILLHSARQTDAGDPDREHNGAGFEFSHNSGFGVPDAGHAVRLALNWPNRPELTELVFHAEPAAAIPDDALRVTLPGGPVEVASIPSTPGVGPVADEPTSTVPLVHVGQALAPIEEDLTGKAALIQRGENFFVEKIDFAAQAGAKFAVIYNNRDATERITMAATDFNTIPAVFVSQLRGEALAEHVMTNGTTLARLEFQKAEVSFAVTDSLLLEHVGVRIASSHRRRGDLRITLKSPNGGRSVLQRVNFDNAPGPVDWTYYSTKHFYEGSAGLWTVEVGDAGEGNSGAVSSVDLILRGVRITDADGDGLDDDWERAFFAHLANGPTGDPDNDGYSNAREQIMGSDPTAPNFEFRLEVSPIRDDALRLSWPGSAKLGYELMISSDLGASWATEVLEGDFPEMERVIDASAMGREFFRVRQFAP